MPRVSVILPVHNGECYITSALTSILKQSFQDFEIVAIDDGSSDATRRILDGFSNHDPRVRVYSQEKMGLTATLNRACSLASGEYIARQDADDLSLAGRLGEQVRFLDANQEVGMCGTWSWIVHPKAGVLASWEFPNDSKLLYQLLVDHLNPFIHGSVMFRREIFNRLPEGYRFGDVAQDLDLWLRMGEISKLGMVQSMQFAYFLSPGSITEQQNALIREETEMIRRLRSQRVDAGEDRSLSHPASTATPTTVGLSTGELGWYGAAVYRLLAGDVPAFRVCIDEVARLEGKFRFKAGILRWLSFLPWFLAIVYRLKMGVRARYMRFYRTGQVRLESL